MLLLNGQKSLQDFREDYFPELEVETKGSNIVNGVAASYYGFSNVGAAFIDANMKMAVISLISC